jgi:iron complex transport system substrate-binding protein
MASHQNRGRLAGLMMIVLLASGCTANTASEAKEDAAGFPVTVNNCGTDVEVEAPPERIVLLESAPVTILDGLGAMDRVVARAGAFPEEYYSEDLAHTIEDIPTISDDLDASGHLQISQEVVIAETPDLVLGLPDGVTREALADSGAQSLVDEQYCSTSKEPATFDAIYDQIDRLGTVLGKTDEADSLNQKLRKRVDKVTKNHDGDEAKTAAILYPSTGGGPLYAYGTGSMAQPQLEALGLSNVFADNTERVFEIQSEELVDRNPDVIVILYQNSTPEEMTDAVTSQPGASTISAVKADRVIPQLFNFTEPASPLTVTGLEKLSKQLDDDA